MPETIILTQKKEGLHRHPTDSIFDTVRKIDGAIVITGKTIKVRTRSIQKMLIPGFFIRWSETIQILKFNAGKVTYPWQPLIESRFGEA
jgi:hypothetical protein